jgi:hypothetical protein
MTTNGPPIPWREIRELVRYLGHEERNLTDNSQPAHIEHAVRTVRQWLNPKHVVDENQAKLPL